MLYQKKNPAAPQTVVVPVEKTRYGRTIHTVKEREVCAGPILILLRPLAPSPARAFCLGAGVLCARCGCVQAELAAANKLQLQPTQKKERKILFSTKEMVEIQDPEGEWYLGIIRAIEGKDRVVHYVGWPQTWDEVFTPADFKTRVRPVGAAGKMASTGPQCRAKSTNSALN